MNLSDRFKIIFSHPLGFILLWITVFGLIAFLGRILEPFAIRITNDTLKLAVIHISSVFAVFCAITIISGLYRTSHLAGFTARVLKIALLPSLLFFVATMMAIRQFPSSTGFILINGISMIILAFILGELLSREVIHPGHLIPVALVLAIVDFWSVGQGPSSEIARQASDFVKTGGYEKDLTPPWTMFLLLRYPQPITSEIYSFLGIGDLVILSFFVGCIHRFNFPKFISYASLVLGTILAVVIANSLAQGIPALPVIAVLFIAVNIKNLPMRKQDILISLAVLIILLVILLFAKFR